MKDKSFVLRKFIIFILIIIAIISFILFLIVISKKVEVNEVDKFNDVDLSNEVVSNLYELFTMEELAYLYDFTETKEEVIYLDDLDYDVRNYIVYKSLDNIDEDSCSNYVDNIMDDWYCSDLYNKNGDVTKVIDDNEFKDVSIKYFGDYQSNDFNISKGSKYMYLDDKYILISTEIYDVMGVEYFKEFKSAKINDKELFMEVHIVNMNEDGNDYLYNYHFIKNNDSYIFDYLEKNVISNE